MRNFQRVVSLAVAQLALTHAHIYFETPQARTCFYGGYFGTDPDGAWRQEPCDRASARPTITYVPGQQICLTLHEFVDHPGYYDIAIAYTPVNPGDTNVDFVPLASAVPDTGDSTGFQSFIVTLPLNRTCEHCTIQVKQWADDLQWFYYACTDIEIVAGSTNTTVEPSSCQFRSGPPLLRILILQSTLISSYFLILVIFLLVWAFVACRSKEIGHELVAKSSDGKIQTSARIIEYSKRHRTFLLTTTALFLVLAVALGVTLIGLKSCW